MGQKKERKAAWIIGGIVVGILLVGIALRTWKEQNVFKYREHLEENAVIIDGTGVSFCNMAYYIAMVEQELQSMAIAYNPANPEEFWNVHFKDLENSAFTSTYAKNIVEELCVYDYVMEQEAIKNGFSLTEEQQKECKRLAVDFYYRMSYEGTENTGITIENLQPMIERNELVKNYVLNVAEEIKAQDEKADVSGLNYDGDYYNTTIKPQYKVEFNTGSWAQVKLGTITVNVVQ